MVHHKQKFEYDRVKKTYLPTGEDKHELAGLASIYYASGIITDFAEFNPKLHNVQDALDRKIVRRYISALYRVKAQDRREYLDWIGDIVGQNSLKNVVIINKNVDAAKYDKPFVNTTYATEGTGQEIIRQPGQVVATQKVYEIPFTQEEFDKLYKDCTDFTSEDSELTEPRPVSLPPQGTMYYVKDVMTNQNYNIPTAQDLRNRSFAELIEYGRTNKWPTTTNQTNQKK